MFLFSLSFSLRLYHFLSQCMPERNRSVVHHHGKIMSLFSLQVPTKQKANLNIVVSIAIRNTHEYWAWQIEKVMLSTLVMRRHCILVTACIIKFISFIAGSIIWHDKNFTFPHIPSKTNTSNTAFFPNWRIA